MNTSIRLKLTFLLVFLPFVSAYPLWADVIYVDANATGANNGSSWTDAYNYLQDALTAAGSGTDIWVAQGTYRPDMDTAHPTGTDDRTATFQLKNDVALYGGFHAGGGSRDPNIYITSLSGDIGAPDDGNDNSYHVVTGSGTNATAILNGFTITAGDANSISDYGGAGIYNSYGSPTLTLCTFSGNYAHVGGGLLNDHSNPTLTCCSFSNNTALDGGGMYDYNSSPTLTNCLFNYNWAASYGGGICNSDFSDPNITNCTFTGNYTYDSGGGIFSWYDSSPTLTNCSFNDNSAWDFGGGMYNEGGSSTVTNCNFTINVTDYGGGMFNYGSDPNIVNCTFTGNVASYEGGGMDNYYFSSPTVTDCNFSENLATAGGGMDNYYFSSPNVTNCTFTNNEAGGGGGMCNRADSNTTVVNCTFSSNSSQYGGGIDNGSSDPNITNCIFNGNDANDGGGIFDYPNSSPTLTNCTFSGNLASYGFGGGIFNLDNSNPTLDNCTFIDNSTTIYGGGVYDNNSSPTFTNCTFYNNSAGDVGGMYDEYGGGIYNEDSNVVITNCTFSGNSTDYGGGIYFDGPGDQNMTNCVFSGNNAKYGGGICSCRWSYPNITNCTFSRNSAINSGGGIGGFYDYPTLTNCIFWGNTAPTWPQIDNELYETVRFSDIQGGWTGTGNINSNPSFVDADGPDNIVGTADDNLRLRFFSDCIDAGDNTTVPAGIVTDLDGLPRFRNDPYTADTGNGTPPIVDMGAYEYQPPPLYVDANSTGANNGKSWADAYKYLQNALAASLSGDSIWVAQGAYRPDANTAHPAGTNDRTATFQLKNGVAIYGGFPTGGGLWEGRKPNAYPTILSGDINVPYDNNDNSYHVITGSGTNSTAVLDGFTITKGYANGASGYRYGGGMYNNTSSPTVTNCTFRSNSALHYGGGVYNEYSSPTVINCIFTTNNTLYGGGMYNVNSDPNIVNCIFTGNLADYYGGGLFNSFSYPTLANCILWGNTAPTGPQMYNEVSTPNVSFSDVQGGWTGTGNINANPLFVDPNGPDNIPGNEDDNLRLSPGSPCIDDGNNSAVPVGIEIDPDGRDRFADGDCNTTIVVDMGAYEFTSAYLGDFDSDVDFLDYAIQANFWLTDEFLMDIAPTPAGDGIIDTSDLAVLCDNWLEIF